MRLSAFIAAASATATAAHGSHHGDSHDGGIYGKEARTDYPNWMTRHMAEEHNTENFDAASFFSLHDFNADGVWERDEMQRLYGLADGSNRGVDARRRDDIHAELLRLLDGDGDGVVSLGEFGDFVGREGHALPDMGTGPGHHGDDEHEYEVHHWNRFHGEQTTLDDLTHPEDVAHFNKHEEADEALARQERLDRVPVVEANIPAKFLRAQH